MNEQVRSEQCAVRSSSSPCAQRTALCALIFFLIYGCAVTQPTPVVKPAETLHGVASWYGQEFAGRTTANGEIFDPLLFTAAHRTLPFGTVVDVTNAKTGQLVRVRVNDRGPFVGNRMIDLSYAAAQQIGLIDPGSGEVDVRIVSVGRGDREPPAAYTVTVPQPAEVKISASEVPKVDFPLPPQVTEVPVVANVQVIEKHGDDLYTRKTVGPDGKTIATVPVAPPLLDRASRRIRRRSERDVTAIEALRDRAALAHRSRRPLSRPPRPLRDARRRDSRARDARGERNQRDRSRAVS